jgi:flagellar hook-basal body complex protein FliE
MAIDALALVKPVGPAADISKSAVSGVDATSFGDKLKALVENVEDKSADANQAVTNMMNKTGDVHDAMIALQRAEMTFQMTMQVRNKLMAAYHEIMRMPV